MSDERAVPHNNPAPEGALCALHPSTTAEAICARCGNYMCAYCSGRNSAAECVACRERAGSGDFPFSRETWSVFALLDYAWQVFRHYFMRLTLMSAAILVGSQVVALALGAMSRIPPGRARATDFVLPALVALSQIGIQVGGQLVLSSWSLRAIDGKPLEFDDALRALRRLPQALLVMLVFGAPLVIVLALGFVSMFLFAARLGVAAYVVGGLLVALAAVAGVYASVGVMFTTFALVREESLDAWGALRQSWDMAEGQRFRLLGAMTLIGLIAGAGVALCVVGVFATMAYASLALGCVYNALRIKEAGR